jgi:hypothetical protein
MAVKTMIEPFRIKSVEPIRWTTRKPRQDLLRAAYYNLFLLPAGSGQPANPHIIGGPGRPCGRVVAGRLMPGSGTD